MLSNGNLLVKDLIPFIQHAKNHEKHSLPDGFTRVDFADDTKKTGLRAVAAKKDSTLVIAFKGSDFGFSEGGFKDLLNDADIAVNSYTDIKTSPSQIKAARKFLIEQLKYALENDLDIVITGHSLGGFLAQVVSNVQYNSQEYSFPFVTFNAPGAEGFIDAPHPDKAIGSNISIHNDFVGQLNNTVGAKRQLVKAKTEHNAHFAKTIEAALESHRNNLTNFNLESIHNEISLSKLTIKDIKLNNGLRLNFQKQLEQHVLALLRTDSKNISPDLLNQIVFDLFPGSDEQFHKSQINFSYTYKDDDDNLKQFNISKKANEGLGFEIVDANEKNYKAIIPIQNLSEPETNIASPYYARAHVNLLKTEIEIGDIDTMPHNLANYLYSLEQLQKRIEKTNYDSKESRALAEEAKRLRQVIHFTKTPTPGYEEQEEALTLARLNALDHLKLITDKYEESLGNNISYQANKFIHKLITPILQLFTKKTLETKNPHDRIAEERSLFLESKTKEAINRLEFGPRIEHLHKNLFSPNRTSFRERFAQAFGSKEPTQQQQWLLKQISWKTLTNLTPEEQKDHQKQLNAIKELYLRFINSDSQQSALNREFHLLHDNANHLLRKSHITETKEESEFRSSQLGSILREVVLLAEKLPDGESASPKAKLLSHKVSELENHLVVRKLDLAKTNAAESYTQSPFRKAAAADLPEFRRISQAKDIAPQPAPEPTAELGSQIRLVPRP